MKRISLIIAIVAILFAGVSVSSSKNASAALLPNHNRNSPCLNWKVVSSPNPGTASNFLYGVAAVAANNVWAVGSYGNAPGGQPLIMHWSKGAWTVVSSPNVAGSLSGIAAVSASDIWAVGAYSSAATLIEHWNGRQWSIVSSPNAPAGDGLSAISIISARDIWAVGTASGATSFQSLTEHWNGTQWSIVPSPTYGQLSSVVAVASNNVWAVGANPTTNFTQSLVLHWNGTQWSAVSSPDPGIAANGFNAIVKVTANNIWAAGGYSNSVGPAADNMPLIAHWNGTQWSMVSSPLQGTSDLLNGMAVTSANNITVVGDYRSGIDPEGPYFTLVEHWNGTQWSVVNSPSPGVDDSDLESAAHVPGSGLTWAVGITYNGMYQTLTEKSC